MLVRGIAELLVPAGEPEYFAGGERESTSEVNGIVGTKRVSASSLGSLGEKCVIDSVDIGPAPDILQVIESPAELGGSQAPPFTHPRESCGRLYVGYCGASDAVRAAVGALGLFGPRLVDQQLD